MDEKKYGQIETGCKYRICEHVGEAEAKGVNGEIDLRITAGTRAPMLVWKGRRFYLPWEDILQLAEDRGFFNEEPTTDRERGNVLEIKGNN